MKIVISHSKGSMASEETPAHAVEQVSGREGLDKFHGF
jgi:hypothetical protein